jgi:hypothetical protein
LASKKKKKKKKKKRERDGNCRELGLTLQMLNSLAAFLLALVLTVSTELVRSIEEAHKFIRHITLHTMLVTEEGG